MPTAEPREVLAVSGGGRVTELRLVVTAADHQSALRFYRDVLGLREQESYDAHGGHVTILDAGRATLDSRLEARLGCS